ncbi:MAG: T9SS type A sorting domain-containing protein [Saprospiraceae bacterium]
MRVLFLFCLLLWGRLLSSQQTYFNVQFDYKNYWEYSALSTIENDSFYLLPAASGTPLAAIWDTAFVLKINKYNATVQYKKIAFFEGQSAVNLRKTSNSDRFLLQGRKYPGHSGTYVDTDIYVCYLNNDALDTSNLKIYGFPNRNDNFYRPLPTSDGGFFSSGWSWDIDASPSYQSLLLFKCDSNLNQQFLKLYPTNPDRHYFGLGCVETPDKGFITVGNKRVESFRGNALVFKTDMEGDIVWWKEIPYNGDTTYLSFQDIVQKADGTYLITGIRTFDPQLGPGHETFWLVNMDGDGKVLWWKEYDPNLYSGWQTITPSLDGNFYACGVAVTYDGSGQQEGYVQHGVISKLTPEGGLLWHRKYTMSPVLRLYDIFFNVLATSDGGILCNGSTYENDTTRQNAWVVKLDGNGCLGPGPGCSTDSEEPIELPVGKNSWVAISPNPTSGVVSITAQGEHRIEALRIFDPAGRLLMERQRLQETSVEADLGSAPAGVYVVSVLVDGVWNVRQVVKTRI